ncbi:MAG: ribokinase [Clostridia bacterium]|nr:ribokinase [Clostridia bacterium]
MTKEERDVKKVIVVGSLNFDIAVYTPRFSTPGESVLGNSVVLGVGGKGSNQATAAHRSGAETVMIGQVGRDFMAELLHKHYLEEGMSERYITVTDKAETGSGVIEIDPSGQNSIIVVKGANGTLSDVEVMKAADEFKSADVVLTQLETGFSSIEKAKELAQENGIPFIINPAPHQPVPDGLFDGVDYLTPNETECEYFSGVRVTDEKSAETAAERLLEMGAKNIIITLGKSGVYYAGREGRMMVPTTDLKSVDSTGAGDAFNGAFAVAVSEGMEIVTALKFANCVASLSVTRYGASKAMPYRSESEKLLKDYYGVTL